MLRFVKLQGCGNDYIYLDCRTRPLPQNLPALCRALCRRRFSVGADGIICICPPATPQADAAMRMWNADGSRGMMCGNGVRCVAEYLYHHGCRRCTLHIETDAGIRALRRLGDGLWQAEMGRFVWHGSTELVLQELQTLPLVCGVSLLSLGNRHAVVHWPVRAGTLPQGKTLRGLARAVLALPRVREAFPDGANVEAVSPGRLPGTIAMRVWELGTGETLACGTGACAAAAAFARTKTPGQEQLLHVETAGGSLAITVRQNAELLLCGPAVTVYAGCMGRRELLRALARAETQTTAEPERSNKTERENLT